MNNVFFHSNHIVKRCFMVSFYFFTSLVCSQSFYELRGSVENFDGKPLEGIEFFLENNPTIGTVSDSLGRFELNVLSKFINDTLIVNGLGYRQKRIPLRNVIKKSFLRITLNIKETSLEEINLILRKNSFTEFSTKTIKQLEIYTNPNSQADVLNGVNSYIGSTNTDETSTPNLRGSSGRNNRVYFNNVPLYNIVKGSGLDNSIGSFSIFNTSIIDEVNIYPSNPPISLPNVSGGAISIQSQENPKDLQNVSLTFAGFSTLYSKPFLNDKGGIQLFSNYTNLSFLKKLNSKSLNTINLYKNFDFGLNSSIKIGNQTTVKLFSQITTENGNYKSTLFSYQSIFKNKNTRLYNVLNVDSNFKKNRFSFNSGYSFLTQKINFGNLNLTQKEDYFYTSFGWKRYISDKMTVRFGINYENNKSNHSGKTPLLFYSYYPNTPSKTVKTVGNLEYLASHFYMNYTLNKNLLIGFGFRNTIYHIINPKHPFGYQGSLRFLSDNKKHKIVASYGNYFSYNIANTYISNTELFKSKQFTLEYSFYSNFMDFQISSYFKEEKGQNFFFESNMVSDGKTILGVDVYIKKNIGENFQVILSNTFLQSKIKFDTQKINASDNLTYFIKAYFNATLKYNTSINLSYISRPGLLYTPIHSSKFIENYKIYRPIYSTDINSKQYNSYHLINVGMSKILKFKNLSSIFFFGINNTFDIKNQRTSRYNRDYTISEDTYYSRITFFSGMSVNW